MAEREQQKQVPQTSLSDTQALQDKRSKMNKNDIPNCINNFQNFSNNPNLIDIINSNSEDICDDIAIKNSKYYKNEEFIDLFKNQNFFKIMTLNCQSLRAKFQEFQLYIENLMENGCMPGVICLQETWLDTDSDLSLLQLRNYSLLSKGRSCSLHGGVALYIHKDYKFKELCINVNSPNWDGQFIELYFENSLFTDSKKFTICNIYRPPTNFVADINSFTEDLENIFQQLDREKNVFIAGDFNIDLLKINMNQHINDHFESIISAGYVACLTLPTRLTSSSGTLIDNILLKRSNHLNFLSGNLISQISDHFPCFLAIKINHINNKKSKNLRIFTSSKDVFEGLKSDLNKPDITEKLQKLNSSDVNMNYNDFNNILQNLIEKHFQSRSVKFNKYKHKRAQWITNGILKSILYRDKLYAKSKKTSSASTHFIEIKEKLKSYNKILRKCIREAKKIYYENIFKKHKNDIKKTWQCINSILNKSCKTSMQYPNSFIINDKNVENCSEIVNHFNKYFTEIGPNLANAINLPDNQSFKDYLIPIETPAFEFKSVTPNDIIMVIDDLKSKISSGQDRISNRLMKHIKVELSIPISNLINQSIKTGVFPNQLKIAKIIPIFKSKNEHVLSNYRPISILPSISKIFEKIMYNQVYNHFNENNLFYPNQYGFRKGHNTEHAVIELIDRIIFEMEKNRTPLNIYLDMTKAFDTLDHEILLRKLEHYGIRNKSLELFSSYMTNRYQYVVLNNTESDLLPIKTGVPQGSILGPLLFIIYINDLVQASKIFKPIIYADDTTLFTAIRALDTQINRSTILNQELSEIFTWLKLNKLSLNCNKTKAMLFHKPQKKVSFPLLKIDEKEIEYVKQFNFLGIIIDSNINWKYHAQNVTKKLSRSLGIMNSLKHILPIEALLHIYNCLFLSNINYGLFLWGWQSKNVGKQVKKAVRIITKSKYNAHTNILFKGLQLLNFESLCTLHDYKICFQLLNKSLPEYLSALGSEMQVCQTRYATRYAITQKFKLPHVKHEYAKQSFRYRIPCALNYMQECIKQKIFTHSLIGFKLYVKHFLINSYNPHCTIPNCFVCS
jgi:hypothetical protein